MAEHTPGPWSYRSQPHDDWGVVRAGRFWICQAKDPAAIDDDTLAAHRRAGTDPWEANARLIAAAPDLLEALLGLQKSFFPDIHPEDDPELVAARAAITKATGEPV